MRRPRRAPVVSPVVSAAAVSAAATLAGAVATASGDLTADQTPFHTYRGLWVSRFEYTNSQAGVDSVFANAQALGITDVMFQVRGQADAYYTPKIVNGNYFEHRTSTNFDALARAISQGQQRGIRVHAWLNAMPLWNGPTLPVNQTGNPYVINTHPEFWIRDANDQPQALNSGYVIVNPTQSDVKQHVREVVRDITGNYAVDGIHLDYIRFYHDTSGSLTPVNYGADPASVARFQSIPGNEGKTPVTHKAEYQAWMADNITDLVAGIRQDMKANRPNAQLTAAVWRDANIGYNGYQQDWKTWTQRGLLDAAMPMIYRKGFGTGGTDLSADSGDLYRNNVTSALNWRGSAGIMPGLGIYLQDDPVTAYNNVTAQLNFARERGANGVQLFSYTDLLGGNTVDAEVRRAWLDFLAANNAPPPVAAITDFEADEGYFPTNITFSGSNVNVAASSTADRTTAEAQSGAASQQLTINRAGAGTFLARHVSGIGSPGSPGSNLTVASVGALGFWLKTATPDVEVAIAIDDNTANTSTERGYFQNVIADGQWHFYQWFLNDPTHWDAWAGANANGDVASLFTLDSIQFRGSEAANVLFLDEIAYDAAAVAPGQWTLDSSVNSNSFDNHWTNAANWQGGIPNGVGATANFLRRATAAQTVGVNENITVGAITFDNSSAYTLAGPGTITIDVASGDGAIAVRNRGQHQVEAAVALADDVTLSVDHKATLRLTGALDNSAGRTLTKSGNGTLMLGGAQTHGAGAAFAADGGTTDVLTDAGAPDAKNLALSATGASTTVNLGVSQHVASIGASDGARIVLAPGGSNLISARAVSVGTGGAIDLAHGAMIVDYDAGATPIAPIRAAVAQGYNGGDWLGAALTSAAAAEASANPSADKTGLGVIEATDVFSTFPATFVGETVDADSVLVRYTLLGDGNLDRAVNIADFSLLASNFNAPAGWFGGDFNYDGAAGIGDFALLASNFNKTLSPPESARPGAIPEPTLSAVAVAAAAFLTRRRGSPR